MFCYCHATVAMHFSALSISLKDLQLYSKSKLELNWKKPNLSDAK